MTDINDVMPKIPSMKWGALMNRAPTNNKVKELNKIFPDNGKWHTVFEEKGIKIIVDPKCLLYLDGTEIDFGKEGLNEGFKFVNPNEKARCGCGESFSV